MDSEDKTPTPKKRATVASVDAKIDDLVEVVDIMSTNVRAIKAALEVIAEVIKKSESEEPVIKEDNNDSMYI
jgi:hypothetical protein